MEIKKSKFITKLYKVYDSDSVEQKLEELRRQYADATHVCYAYIVGCTAKYSDDGEPGGTAGLPMMQVLVKNQMEYILAVVIRYFGGIKLGSGGLVRAYSSSVSEALKKTSKNEIVDGYLIQIVTTYEKHKKLEHLLKDVPNVDKKYLELVTYVAQVDCEMFQTLQEWNPVILKTIQIEKKL